MPIIYAIAAISLLAVNSPRSKVEFTKDSLEVIKKNVDSRKAVLVDVRSIQEWNKGHIEGSIFLPVTSLRKGGDPKVLAKTLPKKKVLYTFCVVGMRAKTAAYELGKHGYTVRAIKPGYDELVEAGFKKGKPQKPKQKNESSRQRNAG
jgi:rhodanese-related sulfurtransferase